MATSSRSQIDRYEYFWGTIACMLSKSVLVSLYTFHCWLSTLHYRNISLLLQFKTEYSILSCLQALVRERMKDWGQGMCKTLNKKMVELTGDYTPDLRALLAADVIIVTPEKWDGISRAWQNRGYVQKVALLVIDEIHLLGADRWVFILILNASSTFITSQGCTKMMTSCLYMLLIWDVAVFAPAYGAWDMIVGFMTVCVDERPISDGCFVCYKIPWIVVQAIL